MRKLPMIVVLVLVALGVGWLVWVKSAHGFSANASPTWIEARLAALSRRLALPSGQDAVHDPQAVTPQRLAAALVLYHSQCELCHDANGDGRTSLGQSLFPKPPDLRGQTQNKSDGVLFYSIRNGIRMSGMPAWNQDTDQEVWNLVALIRSFRQP